MNNDLRLVATCEIEAAAGDGKRPRLSILAYGGDVMSVDGFGPLAIDLKGLALPRQVPVLADHSNVLAGIAGHGTPTVRSNQLHVEGTVSNATDAGKQVLALAADGVLLQASVGVKPTKTERIGAGESVAVNGRTIKASAAGFVLVRAGQLREVSIVAIGADIGTSVAVVAKGGQAVDFDQFCASNGFDPSTMSEQQRSFMRARFELEHPPAPTISAADRERERVEAIRSTRDDFLAGDLGTGVAERIQAAAEKGIAAGWDRRRAELEFVRESRPIPPGISTTPQTSVPDLLTAALMTKAGFEAQAEKMLGAQVMERSRKLHGMSLAELCRASLQMDRRDAPNGRDQMIRAAISTGSMPVALSNTANKVLMMSYQQAPAAWRSFAAVKATNDFKENTGVRPTFNNTLQQLAPGGEIMHATYAEETYKWKVDTFVRTLGIDRRDWINDDVAVFGEVIPSFAKAAARSLSNLVATVILANVGNAVAFWTLARLNYFEGASSVLSSTSLATAIKLLRQMKDADGNLLDLQPAVLLVPPELERTARELLESAEIQRTTTDGLPTGNVYKNAAALAIEPRLSDSGFTGNSAVAWYLFSDPSNASVVVGFLDGLETPTLETFGLQETVDVLAYRFRVYHDYGAALADFRAAIKSKGAA